MIKDVANAKVITGCWGINGNLANMIATVSMNQEKGFNA